MPSPSGSQVPDDADSECSELSEVCSHVDSHVSSSGLDSDEQEFMGCESRDGSGGEESDHRSSVEYNTPEDSPAASSDEDDGVSC